MSATHDDYVNMRLLVDVAEHTHDDVALRKLAEYIETIEALDRARINARSKLPIAPLRIGDMLPVFTATRGGITYYEFAQDFSGEAERKAKRREAIIGLFKMINTIQWGNGIESITEDHLKAISARAADAVGHFQPPTPADHGDAAPGAVCAPMSPHYHVDAPGTGETP